ncbi:MAG: phosphoribosylamine--glycine ligase [Thermoplasmata archaeon]|nr:phosphoribosylamine--glycine ligase [Thermoplasmata archaeon]
MKILVVGGGAREHAITEALSKDDTTIFAVMKNRNPGIAKYCEDILYLAETEVEKITDWASDKGIEMVIIGPEGPLEAGLVDELLEVGIPCIGPTKELARLETSKAFTRGLFEKYDIPGNAKYAVFHNLDGMRDWMERLGEYVIKDDGLCGGKGVKLSGEHLATIDDGLKYAEECILKHGSVVIEEKFVGEEFSLQALSDGHTVIGSPLAQDHKRAYEGDTGPNTGGMGSYSDSDHSLPFLRPGDYEEALAITQRACDALREECGTPYKGVMYGGFIATKDGVKCVEFNARFGDPEALNVLPLLESSFLKICQAVIDGNLTQDMAVYSNKATVCKYIVPKGYGVKSLVGAEVTLDEKFIEEQGAKLYYASVNEENGKVYTTGSRSLGVIGIADTINEAERICERAVNSIKGEVFMRHDIGTPEALEKRINRMREIRD